jgi:nucleolar protein 14
LAAEAAEKLVKAEEARLRRMRGEEEPEETEERKGKKRAPQADDLADDYVGDDEEDVFALGRGLDGDQEDQEMVVLGNDEEQGSDDGEEEAEDDDDEEESGVDGEGLLSDDDDAEVDDGHAQDLVPTTSGSTSKSRHPAAELPYSFPCPESHDDLLHLLGGLPDSEVITLIDRVKVLYHPKLGEANKGKLQVRLFRPQAAGIDKSDLL